MRTLWQDTRYGLRMLLKSPGFFAVAVLTLALGIGANTAIFSLIDALLFKSLPEVRDPRELVLVTDNGSASLSYPLYEYLRDNNQSLSGLFVSPYIDKRRMGIAGSDSAEQERVWNQPVSGDFFPVLGVSAALGRMLTPDDDRPGEPRSVVVISHDFWSRRFGRNPEILGKTLTLDDIPLTIVGVAPQGFVGFAAGSRPDIWWPIQLISRVTGNDWLTEGGSQWLQIAGRLKLGVTATQAREELDGLYKRMLLAQTGDRQLSEKERQELQSHGIELQPAAAGFVSNRGELQRMLIVLMAIVGAVLLVACTNLAGLLLARGATRQREFSVRAALGAGRSALIRQLLTESLLLAVVGGVSGLLLAQGGVRLLVHYVPDYGQSVFLDLTPDARILAFTFLITVGTGLLFGLIPAWQNSRQEVVAAIKDQAGAVTGRGFPHFWSKALMVPQIALSFCLLIGAGLFVRTLQKLQTLDVGFDRENLMVFYLDLGNAYDETRRGNFHQQVMDRIRDLPTVHSAAMSNIQTLGGAEIAYGPFEVTRAEKAGSADEKMKVRGTGVTLGYFQAMRIPVLMGRDFGPEDEPTAQSGQAGSSARPIIIDQACARQLFGNENPIGKLLTDGRRSREVIGVVGNVVHKGLRRGPRVSVYSLDTCRSRLLMFFHVRTSGDPLVVADGIRQVIRNLDPRVEVEALHTMREMVASQLQRERMLSQLGGFFSLSALSLACLGIYGILSYAVARRTREIGIRMALGARRSQVLSSIVWQGMKLAAVGCVLGVILAVALTRVASSLLYGVTPTDPLTFVLATVLLVAVGCVSCWLPARRAAKIDPMAALRCE
ncbi:MAG: ABC transporter permease [Solirubrobacterales bacterium]